MDSLDPASPAALAPAVLPPDVAVPRPPRIWKFWGTMLWGLFIFAALFVGQIAVVVWFLVQQEGPIDGAAILHLAGDGLVISLSVLLELPAVLAALWIAIRLSRTPFTDYLALRWTSWTNVLIGVVSLLALVLGWEALSEVIGHESAPGFMINVLKSARADGVVWLLVIAFAVVAPMSEELLVRGFLYRGWSESVLGPVGAILLSSLIWTAVHLQYDLDWFPFVEVLSIGLLLGYLRYRFNSTWLTIILHGLNNLGAVVQTFLLAGST
jgi:membrane protease YdiL (CAAX protease family)